MMPRVGKLIATRADVAEDLRASARAALVMCASIPWSFHRNRQQELAERLSDFMPVIYIEPPLVGRSLRSPASGPLRTVKDGCHVLPAPNGLPGDRFASPVNWIVQRRLARSLVEALGRLDLECAVLWVDRIQSAALLDRFPEALVVYDCVDEAWTFGRLRRRSYLRQVERFLARRADITIASSHGLRQRLSRIARRVELVPNGCDFAHFSRPARRLDRPSDLPPAGSAHIGFIGGVARRSLDYGLLRFAAARLPDCRFVFVGAFDAASKRALGEGKNIALLGAQPYSDLPSYLASFDVAIIPYAVGGQIDYVYPKKLHEYLAAGRPVVATDLPALRPFEGVVKIGRSRDEFVALIQECLKESADPALSARLAAQRRAVAAGNTWEHRVEQIVGLLDTGLRERGLRAILDSRAEDHA